MVTAPELLPSKPREELGVHLMAFSDTIMHVLCSALDAVHGCMSIERRHS